MYVFLNTKLLYFIHVKIYACFQFSDAAVKEIT
jgi:hypothetical protein